MPTPLPANDVHISEAARLLRAGRLVAFATETVYGLGADATNDAAVAQIFAAKGRPTFNPLICHFAAAKEAQAHVVWNDRAERLARAFWPGPLTLVLPKKSDSPISKLASAGLDSLAVRVPRHETAQALLRACGFPLAAPSANSSGRLSPTQAGHVAADLGDRVAMILDSGPCAVGLESSVVGLLEESLLLRPGGLAPEAIEAEIGPLIRVQENETAPPSPGLLLRHYAPRARLRLDAMAALNPDEALLAFGPRVPHGFRATLNLSPRGDVVEAAAHLFDYLHRLDALRPDGIAVMPIPDQGLGVAINDRLRRAAEGSRHHDN